MTSEEFKRKLTAILSADVKGYSRLMGADEEATVRTLQAYKEVMASSIQHHRGRVVGTAGDSVLAEFASVVDTVQCAVEIQQVLRAKNAMLSETRRMEFRIGINLGDVIEEGDTIYGDGVNIAARVEGLAEQEESASPKALINRSRTSCRFDTTTLGSTRSRTLSSQCGFTGHR